MANVWVTFCSTRQTFFTLNITPKVYNISHIVK